MTKAGAHEVTEALSASKHLHHDGDTMWDQIAPLEKALIAAFNIIKNLKWITLLATRVIDIWFPFQVFDENL